MNPSGEELPQLLQKAKEHSVAVVRPVLAEYGLTEEQWRVLRVLHGGPELSAHKLAAETGILSPSLSRMLARLESESLLERRQDSTDQRAQQIRLTPRGKRICEKIAPLVGRQYNKLRRRLGRETILNLVEVLQEFNALEKRKST